MAFWNPAYCSPMALPLPSDDNNWFANYQRAQQVKMQQAQSKYEFQKWQECQEKSLCTRRWSVPCEAGFDECKKSMEVEIVAPYEGDSVLTVSGGVYVKAFHVEKQKKKVKNYETFWAHYILCNAHAKLFEEDGVRDDIWFGYESYLHYVFKYNKSCNYNNLVFLQHWEKMMAGCKNGATQLK